MANEPERPVENALRAYAEQRRRQAGQLGELHPADRRILQAEVARTFPPLQTPGRQGFLSIIIGVWPRLVGGCALLLGIGLLAWHFSSSPNRLTELAKNEKLPSRMPVEVSKSQELADNRAATATSAALAPTAPAAASVYDKAKDAPAGLELAQTVTQLSTSRSAVAASSASSRAEPELAASAPAQSAAFFLSQEREQQEKQLTQLFVRAPAETGLAGAAARQRPAAASLLDSFRVEQTGQQVRVIDRDGSVYTGSLTPPQVTANRALQRAANPSALTAARDSSQTVNSNRAALSRAISTAPQTFSFRVAGTNLSLKQQVVFSGQLMPLVVSLAGVGATNGPSGGMAGRVITPAQQSLPSVPDCRIIGSAVVDGGPEIPINALPANK